ncbi:hypothetical protein [Sporichthya sp.]|uniref:hypothetical protein n=1 Tax=Sporichthya sp. TaxID=65475 RepID=UPI00181101A2|nr:hypothetical protein [Sporichthya sp.]MBA3741844.1 hypothetical protein [Sporichthya sp.]
MDTRMLRWCAASGPVCVAVFLLGFFVIAGFVPPPSPRDDMSELRELFYGDVTTVRIGLILAVVAAAFIVPWVGAISTEMKRLEGADSPLAFTQLATGALLFPLFALPPIIWQAIAYRTDTSDEILRMMNDLAWLMFVAVTWTAVLQALTIGIVILRNSDQMSVFPRWVGYLNLWVALMFIPGTLAPLVKSGPLAWNGILTWWIPVVTFVAWMLIMSALMIRNRPVSPQMPTDRELAPSLAHGQF